MIAEEELLVGFARALLGSQRFWLWIVDFLTLTHSEGNSEISALTLGPAKIDPRFPGDLGAELLWAD